MSVPWHDMFVLQLPVLEKLLRPVCVYLFLLIGLRLAGKRELAQLNPFDLVVLLTLSNTVQNAIIGDDNTVTGGLLGAAMLLLVNYLVVRFVHRHHGLERLVEGSRDYVIRNGHVLRSHLDKELMSRAELAAAVEESARARYERLVRSKGENVVVGVNHGVCGGCHMKLPPQILVFCMADQEIITCTNCGRILYYTRDMALTVPE